MKRAKLFRTTALAMAMSIVLFLPLMKLTCFAAQETYQFERMWPTLKQPWYFNDPRGIAVDHNGYFYIMDRYNDLVLKFSTNGHLVNKWRAIRGGSGGIAVDRSENIYVVARTATYKYAPNGVHLLALGQGGEEEDRFINAEAVATDVYDNVYVTDSGNHDIQIFDSEGNFLRRWGSLGAGDGEFNGPIGIDVDADGYVYVADKGNKRIQILRPDGTLYKIIAEWKATNQHPAGKIGSPLNVAVGPDKKIYVTDVDPEYNDDPWSRILIFSQDGNIIHDEQDSWKWHHLSDIAVSESGDVFVTDVGKPIKSVFKCDDNGKPVFSFQSYGNENGKFHMPRSIAIDKAANIYIADMGNVRVQKLNQFGEFIHKWDFGKIDWDLLEIIVALKNKPQSIDLKLIDPALFQILAPLYKAYDPVTETVDWSNLSSDLNRLFRDRSMHIISGLSVDHQGDIYVCDGMCGCIHRISQQHGTIQKCFINNPYPDRFFAPSRIAISQTGALYVTDEASCKVYQYDKNGALILEWGGKGVEDGQFLKPNGVSVNNAGDVFVVDSQLNKVQVFNEQGDYLWQWDQNGKLGLALGITTDHAGLVYVTGSDKVSKFDAHGELVAAWGKKGVNPGQFNYVDDVAIDESGRVYVVDQENDRIQTFVKIAKPSQNKAIIVAGGGPYQGNNLWDATQICANFAYRALLYQGFTHDTIHYLTSNSQLDLDDNGVPDEVDGDSTYDNLKKAITEWAATDAQNLVLYLTDHGGNSLFKLNEQEMLRVEDLNQWLNLLQPHLSGHIIIIYDACHSGSFIPGISGSNRIVVTSSASDENAVFVSQGSVSFSFYFWTNIFNGENIKQAFQSARDAIKAHQTPLLEADGDNLPNTDKDYALSQYVYIGSGYEISAEAPQIEHVPPNLDVQGMNTVKIYAIISAKTPITRVWAEIHPPGIQHNAIDGPILKFPTLELRAAGANYYEALSDQFQVNGAYIVSIFAIDQNNHQSAPKSFTVKVNNSLRRRAILAAAGNQTDENWPAIQKGIKLAYDALSFQGYATDDIYLLSPSSLPGIMLTPVTPDPENLKAAIETWAGQDVRDIIIYIVGNGTTEAFNIGEDVVTSHQLGEWLNAFQRDRDVFLTVIYDADKSGNFIEALKPPTGKNRILITSVSRQENAYLLSNGTISFSSFFWKQVSSGATVAQAFTFARNATVFTSGLKEKEGAQLDASGNGVANEKIDGERAKNYTIGLGIILADDIPLIGSINPEISLSASSSAHIWVENITAANEVETVWAVIWPPAATDKTDQAPVVIELAPVTEKRYEQNYHGFDLNGRYHINVYAMDRKGALSSPKRTTVTRTMDSETHEPDDYEPDDEPAKATYILVNDPVKQRHNFHHPGDQDWGRFYAYAGRIYEINATNLEPDCDPVIALYDHHLELIEEKDSLSSEDEEHLSWLCPSEGMYYIKVYHSDKYGPNTGYDLNINEPVGPIPGQLNGFIRDANHNQPISGAEIEIFLKMNKIAIGKSIDSGFYMIKLEPGEYTVRISAEDYQEQRIENIKIEEDKTKILDISLSLKEEEIKPPDNNNGGGGGGGGGCFLEAMIE